MKIKDEFKGWFEYDTEEFENVLKDGLICFDTNIILSLFKLSNTTTSAMLEAFETIKNRIVVPYYVIYEFTRNRKKVISDSYGEYDKMISALTSKYSAILHEFDNVSEKKLSEKENLIGTIKKNQEKVIKAIIEERDAKAEVYKSKQIELKVFELFNDKIIDKYPDDEFEKVRVEGIRRQKEQIPPGYMDSDKPENGDYHIFKSLIDYCKKNKKDLIFVTDDTKEDWFRNFSGIKVPREELLNEFFKETGQLIIILKLHEFLGNTKIIRNKIDSDVLDEIKISFVENEFINTKGMIRTKNLFKRLLKYNSIQLVKDNILEINTILRTLSRIGNGVDDFELVKKIQILNTFLKTKKYGHYLSSIANVDSEISRIRFKYIGRISEIMTILEEDYSVEKVVEILNLFVDYFKQFSNKTIDEKIALLKTRDLLKMCNDDYIEEEKAMKILTEIYSVVKYEDDQEEIVA